MAQTLTNTLVNEYQICLIPALFNPKRKQEIDRQIDIMVNNKMRYEAVANKLNVPWYFIAIIHCMEGSLSFNKHLHNGDSLTQRTINVPTGRPLTGEPPFEWEAVQKTL
jgi:lysozyme family protein